MFLFDAHRIEARGIFHQLPKNFLKFINQTFIPLGKYSDLTFLWEEYFAVWTSQLVNKSLVLLHIKRVLKKKVYSSLGSNAKRLCNYYIHQNGFPCHHILRWPSVLDRTAALSQVTLIIRWHGTKKTVIYKATSYKTLYCITQREKCNQWLKSS